MAEIVFGDPGKKWGIDAFRHVLPAGLKEGSVIAIEGPRGTFKTNLAMTFLAQGLKAGETCMLIRLHDQPLLNPERDRSGWPALSCEVVQGRRPESGESEQNDSVKSWHAEPFEWSHMEKVSDPLWPESKPEVAGGMSKPSWQALASKRKAVITVWRTKRSKAMSSDSRAEGDDDNAYLFEIDFKGGHILPEEFIHIVWDVILRRDDKTKPNLRVKRVVLDDVDEIGAAYPFLRKSSTSGDIFLPTFAHVMRNYSIDFVVTGTTGEFSGADEAVARICAVADTVISCRFCDVFGKRHVIVQGEGLIAQGGQPGERAGSFVPPVVHNEADEQDSTVTTRRFRVDPQYLEGLVGFGTGRIYRPGVSLHVFEENELVHRAYNQEVATMLRAAFASQAPTPGAVAQGESSVALVSFGSAESEAIHDSADVFPKGAPLDCTVVCTVDEFCRTDRGLQGKMQKGRLQRQFIPFNASNLLQEAGVVEQEGRRIPRLMIKDPSQILCDDGTQDRAFVWPYYMNLLLLAYRKDALQDAHSDALEAIARKYDSPPSEWQSPDPNGKYTWNKLLEVATGIRRSPRTVRDDELLIRRCFWFDHSASETLSCALLDALVSADFERNPAATWNYEDRRRRWTQILQLQDEEPTGRPGLREVGALYELFQLTGYEYLSRQNREKYARILPDDAGLYLCWYSQLRELLTRQPALASEMRVCPLPGRGFTGDWFVGIASGSVSPALGKRLIDMLCRKSEDYKRFSRGVGLPIYEKFEDKEFFSWLRGHNVPLQRVLNMHKDANSRADIKEYELIRSTLHTIAKQLTPMAGPEFTDNHEDAVEIIVGRLYQQIKILRDL